MQNNSQPIRWKLPFFTIWTGQAISLFGSSLVQFALVWWLTQTTQSATVLAMATLVALLPNILLGPLAGVLVDRWNRRVVMIVADSLVTLATLGLAYLFWIGAAQLWHVYAAMLIRAAAGTFQAPAMTASTSLMVPKEQLARVSGFNQMLNGGMNIIAPPIGALLLGLLPLQGVLAVDVVTALFGIVPLFFIRIPQPLKQAPEAAQASGQPPSFLRELRAGFKYVQAWSGLMLLLLMATAINFLLTPTVALLPILVTKYFRGTAWHLATMESAFGIGVIVGGLLLGIWGGFKRRIVTSLMGLAGLGLGFVVIGLTPATLFWLAVASAFVAAVMQAFTNGPLMAVLQATVAPEMQGRVFSLIGAVATMASPLSLLVAGPVADAIGVQAWYIVGGLACILISAASAFIPAILYLEDHHAQTAMTEPTASAEKAAA
jgi:DHA3 family macrolide efflux protein-like MFS transporter